MENITLGSEPSSGLPAYPSTGRSRQRCPEMLDHGALPLAAPVHQLSIAEQQIVEIARALLSEPKVLIMDEPTSSLTRVDVENLFVIRKLKDAGPWSTSAISSRNVSRSATDIPFSGMVNRWTPSMKKADLKHIIRMMVGREMKDIYPSRQPNWEPLLEIKDLAGRDKPRSASWTLRRGEIYGIAGLVGAGRTETLRACFGLDPIVQGSLTIEGVLSTAGSPRKRLRQGMGLLSENRKEEGLLLNRDLADNLTLTHFGPFTRAGLIARGKQLDAAQHWIEKLQVKTQGLRSMWESSQGATSKRSPLAVSCIIKLIFSFSMNRPAALTLGASRKSTSW